jgi:hypothetical protein
MSHIFAPHLAMFFSRSFAGYIITPREAIVDPFVEGPFVVLVVVVVVVA